jgi:hypothetical protein
MSEERWHLHLDHVLFKTGLFITAMEITFGDGHAFNESVEFLDLGEVLLVAVLVLELSIVAVKC